MSYCRFTESSDVYAYECAGGVQFWVAGKANKCLDRLCNTFGEAYLYAKELRDEHGLNVPDTAIEELWADAVDELKTIMGQNSAASDIQAENAKLIVKLNAEHIVRQNVEVENSKLRERVAELEELLPDSGRWYRAETVEAYVAEIAKLRELVQRMRRYMVGAVEHCGYDAQTTGYTMLGSRLEECENAMRELGMELDG